MKQYNQHVDSSRTGFSLLELLTVIAIIAVLVGMVSGLSGYANAKSAAANANAQLERLKLAIQNFKIQEGYYPDTDDFGDLLDAIYFEQIKNKKQPYIEFEDGELTQDTVGSTWHFYDPWGQDYNYDGRSGSASDLRNNQDTYDLWSKGPNVGKPINYAGDDITNW